MAAVPPYLCRSDDNPDGGPDDATIEQFQQGVVRDRPAFLDGFTAEFFDAGGKGLLDRTSGEGSEQRQYALREGGPHGINASHPEQFDEALVHFLRRWKRT